MQKTEIQNKPANNPLEQFVQNYASTVKDTTLITGIPDSHNQGLTELQQMDYVVVVDESDRKSALTTVLSDLNRGILIEGQVVNPEEFQRFYNVNKNDPAIKLLTSSYSQHPSYILPHCFIPLLTNNEVCNLICNYLAGEDYEPGATMLNISVSCKSNELFAHSGVVYLDSVLDTINIQLVDTSFTDEIDLAGRFRLTEKGFQLVGIMNNTKNPDAKLFLDEVIKYDNPDRLVMRLNNMLSNHPAIKPIYQAKIVLLDQIATMVNDKNFVNRVKGKTKSTPEGLREIARTLYDYQRIQRSENRATPKELDNILAQVQKIAKKNVKSQNVFLKLKLSGKLKNFYQTVLDTNFERPTLALDDLKKIHNPPKDGRVISKPNHS